MAVAHLLFKIKRNKEYDCIRCEGDVLHKHGRNTSADGLSTSWAVPPSIVSLYIYALSSVCALLLCFMCFMWLLCASPL
jgi:hypothetical protein